MSGHNLKRVIDDEYKWIRSTIRFRKRLMKVVGRCVGQSKEAGNVGSCDDSPLYFYTAYSVSRMIN